jgi:hypothetical protein
MAGNAERRLPPMVPPNLDADGSATTYPDARAALGGNATKMVDLCLTMACDDAMSAFNFFYLQQAETGR